MKSFCLSLIAAFAIMVQAGQSLAYQFEGQYGADVIRIQAGDLGVWGATKWLAEQELLPAMSDGTRMPVAVAYVKICQKNFPTLQECEKQSRHFQPGDTLRIIVPTISREEYRQQVTAPIEKELAIVNAEKEALAKANTVKDRTIRSLKGTIGGLIRTIDEQKLTVGGLYNSIDHFNQKLFEDVLPGYAEDLQKMNLSPWQIYLDSPMYAFLVALFLAFVFFAIHRESKKALSHELCEKRAKERDAKIAELTAQLSEERRQNSAIFKELNNFREGEKIEDFLPSEPGVKATFEIEEINLKCLSCGEKKIKGHHRHKHLSKAHRPMGKIIDLDQPSTAIN